VRWNGRQIRNTFQTALALAEFAVRNRESVNPVLTKKHFKIIVNASIQFNEYLLATHGADEDKVAKREYMRAVEYSPSPGLVFAGFSQEVSDSSSEEEEEEEDSSDGSGTDSDLEDSDESDGGKKKKKDKGKKDKKGNKSKSSSKESKKTSDKVKFKKEA
jgi:hypothetical protein